MTSHKNFVQPLQFTKSNFLMLEQERNMLKITLQYISTENDKLKNELEDMKITAKQNKELLKEYVNQITNKDKVFEKMNSQIEQLTNRLKSLENTRKLNLANQIIKKAHKKENISQTNPPSTLASTSTIPKNSNLSLNKSMTSNGNNKSIDVKSFLSRQAAMIEEISSIKDDIQFLMENKQKSKMKEKLNQSIISMNTSMNQSINQSMNQSVIHSHNMSYMSSNNNSKENSLNSSFVSTNTVRRKFNIKDRFVLDDNLTDFLNNYNQYKDILFLIDNKGNVWELIKRIDLTMNMITAHPTNLKSIVFCEKIQDKLVNIEIKDPFDDRSLITTDEDLNKYSEFNFSKYIKEIE